MFCVTYYDMHAGNPACQSLYEAFIVCLTGVPCGNILDQAGCEAEVAELTNSCS